jgi:hypothetical protein
MYLTFNDDGTFANGPTHPPSLEQGTYTVQGDTLTMIGQGPPEDTIVCVMTFTDADNVVVTSTTTGNDMPLTRYVGQ